MGSTRDGNKLLLIISLQLQSEPTGASSSRVSLQYCKQMPMAAHLGDQIPSDYAAFYSSSCPHFAADQGVYEELGASDSDLSHSKAAVHHGSLYSC